MKNIIAQIEKAKYLLNHDEMIALPTEGIFGFGANLFSFAGCLKIFNIKGRNYKKPLSLLCQNLSQALNFAYFSDTAIKLANAFWPGPLNLVLPINQNKSNIFLTNICAKEQSIAVRVPDHWLTLLLLSQLRYPIANSSANLSGTFGSTCIKHLKEDFADKFFTLEYDVNIGTESTILGLANESKIKILRSGPISAEDIFNKTKIIVSEPNFEPITEIILKKNQNQGTSTIHLNFGSENIKSDYNLNLSVSRNLQEAALNFYSHLRLISNYIEQSEKSTIKIFIARLPNNGIGIALNHRLHEFKQILEAKFKLKA